MYNFKVYKQYIKMGVMRFTEYRSSFLAGLVGLIMINGVSILLIWVMLSNFNTLDTWSFWEIVFNYCLFLTCLGFHNTFFRHISDLETHILEGSFDRFLLKPFSPFLQLVGDKVSLPDICDFLVGLVGVLFAYRQLKMSFSILKIILLIIYILNGIYLFTIILFAISCLSFWTMKSRPIVYGTSEIQESVQHYPIGIFGKGFKVIVSTLIPYALINYYPSLIILDKATDKYVHIYIALIFFIDFVYLITSKILWSNGLKRYKSSGS